MVEGKRELHPEEDPFGSSGIDMLVNLETLNLRFIVSNEQPTVSTVGFYLSEGDLPHLSTVSSVTRGLSVHVHL